MLGGSIIRVICVGRMACLNQRSQAETINRPSVYVRCFDPPLLRVVVGGRVSSVCPLTLRVRVHIYEYPLVFVGGLLVFSIVFLSEALTV